MKLDNQRVTIVTGGAGFIGSTVLRELNDRGITNIVVFDNLGTSEKWQNLVGKVFSDVLHKSQLFEYLDHNGDGVGAIVHLGACSSTVERDAQYLLENNYRYSRRLAEWALPRDIRFVYASSAATYGNGLQGFDDDTSLLETLYPLNMYGYSKHLFDCWLSRNGFLDRVTGLKYFNVYGPNEWHKGRMASAIVRMVPEALTTKSIRLFSSRTPGLANGEQSRDFIYVKDVAAITCDLLVSSHRGIVNVGTGEASTWNRLATAVFSALSLPVNIEYISMPEDLIGKYQEFTQATTQRLEKGLGRKACRYSLENAVGDYVNCHLLQEKRW